MMDKVEQIIKDYQPKPYDRQKEYAVLLLLIDVNGITHVLYEVRGNTISQPGDTSFPGGRIEAGETPCEAAIRETVEELHIRPDQIQILGAIDYIVRDWAIVYCFVGRITDFDFRRFLKNDEVDHLFIVPLQYLLDHEPTYYQINIEERMAVDFPFERIHRGKNYKFHRSKTQIPFYHLGLKPEEQLWGMTANLTHRFCQIILQQGGEPQA